MPLSIIQIILLLAILIFVVRAAKKLKNRVIYSQDFIMQVVFWGLAAYVVIRPDTTQLVADFVGVGRGVDLVIYASLLILFFFFFMLLGQVHELKQQITKLGREIALRDAHVPDGDKNKGKDAGGKD